jgi:hypothetical protein
MIRNKSIALVFSTLTLIGCYSACELPAAAYAASPTIDKTTVSVRARRRTGTYEEIEKRGFAIWGWTPEVDFRVNGPITAGAQLLVEIAKPDGKPWLKYSCSTNEVKEGAWWQVESCGRDIDEEKLAREVGMYGFTISLKDELAAGSNQILFTGKLNVKKFFAGGVEPKSEQHFGYYVDYDWYLPIGQVYAKEPYDDYAKDNDESEPLAVSLWFRGKDAENDVSAHLFYKGQEISNTKDSAKGTLLGEKGLYTFDDSKFNWQKVQFIFTNALVFNHENPDNHKSAFRLDKNPGEYTIKVLRKGSLTRVLSFAVGPDGKLLNTGVGAKNSIGNGRIIVPVTVTGDEAGAAWDKDAWKTGAFFSNPLNGFQIG